MFAIIVDGNITSDACVGREAGRALFPRTKVVLVCWIGSIVFNKV